MAPSEAEPVGSPASDRRLAILHAAAQEFSEFGFADAGMRRIAARAGVATGTVYLYFASKESLLSTIIGDLGQILVGRIALRRRHLPPESHVVDKLAVSIAEALSAMAEHRSLARAVLLAGVGHPTFEPMIADLHDQLAQFVAADLEEACQVGLIGRLDAAVAGRAWVGSFYEVVVAWLRAEPAGDLSQALPTLLAYNLRGIGYRDAQALTARVVAGGPA